MRDKDKLSERDCPPLLFADLFPHWRKIVFALEFGIEKTIHVFCAGSFCVLCFIVLSALLKISWWVIFIWKF